MKVAQYTSSFRPVTLTLESADEVKVILELLGSTRYSTTAALGVAEGVISNMYHEFSEAVGMDGESLLNIEPANQ